MSVAEKRSSAAAGGAALISKRLGSICGAWHEHGHRKQEELQEVLAAAAAPVSRSAGKRWRPCSPLAWSEPEWGVAGKSTDKSAAAAMLQLSSMAAGD